MWEKRRGSSQTLHPSAKKKGGPREGEYPFVLHKGKKLREFPWGGEEATGESFAKVAHSRRVLRSTEVTP